MEIVKQDSREITVLKLKGDLTYEHRRPFQSAVEAVKGTACRHLILNMEQVQFLDSSGLGLLALLSQNLKLSNIRLSVVNPQSYVKEIMALANISKLVPIYQSEAEAIASKPSLAA
jgi:anti-anti-sigma factor